MKIIFHKCKTNSYKYKYFDYYLFSLNFHANKKQNLKNDFISVLNDIFIKIKLHN